MQHNLIFKCQLPKIWKHLRFFRILRKLFFYLDGKKFLIMHFEAQGFKSTIKFFLHYIFFTLYFLNHIKLKIDIFYNIFVSL